MPIGPVESRLALVRTGVLGGPSLCAGVPANIVHLKVGREGLDERPGHGKDKFEGQRDKIVRQGPSLRFGNSRFDRENPNFLLGSVKSNYRVDGRDLKEVYGVAGAGHVGIGGY